MNKTFESPINDSSGSEIVEKLALLVGGHTSSRLYSNLLKAIRVGGKEQARIFCWNEGDKFRDRPDIISFLEKEVFDAGEDGVATKTPWNMSRRNK